MDYSGWLFPRSWRCEWPG